MNARGILLLCALALCWSAGVAAPTAFVNVTVVPMDRARVLDDWTVIVDRDRIRTMGPSSSTRVPSDAAVIDGTGKYLMPGLADMHAHTWDENHFPLLMANGITTIRNMFGGPIHLRWRERAASGNWPWPTVYSAGPIIDGNPPVWPGAVVETVEQAHREVAEQQKAGYDFLKVYSRLSAPAYAAIIEAASTHRMPVVGHVPSRVGLSIALRSGIESIEHLSGYETLARESTAAGEEASWARLDESRFAAVARETAISGTWNCPTLVLYQYRIAPGEGELLKRWLARPEMKYVSRQTIASWHPENNFLRNSTPVRAASSRNKGDVMRKKLVKALHDAGARLLLGTDYGNPFVIPGFSVHEELRNLADAGLSPYEALRAGTSGAAEFMNLADEFGTVAVGRRADLILVDDNPLEDVSNVRRPQGVMVSGVWHTRAALDEGLEKLAQSMRSSPHDAVHQP